MAQALPIAKLISLSVKTLAKPLSKRIKHEFSRYDITKRILIGIGQTQHRVSSRLQIWSAGYRVRSIKPLEDEKAMKDGAEFVGETFIFGVSVSLLLFEYTRSANSTKKKEDDRRQKQKEETAALNAKLHALDVRLKAVENVVEQNSASILSLGGTKYVKPPSEELVPIDDDEEQQQNNKANATTTTTTSKEDRSTSSSGPSADEKQPKMKPWWKIW